MAGFAHRVKPPSVGEARRALYSDGVYLVVGSKPSGTATQWSLLVLAEDADDAHLPAGSVFDISESWVACLTGPM